MTDYSYTGTIEDVTISTAGIYQITADGAQGGTATLTNGEGQTSSYAGGLGAVVSGDVYFNAGTVLEIVVGGEGGSDQEGAGGGGGGGGSFIIEINNGEGAVDEILAVAGGGGGAQAAASTGIDGQPSVTGPNGTDGAGFRGGKGGQDGAGGAGSGGLGGGGGGGFEGGDGATYIRGGNDDPVTSAAGAGTTLDTTFSGGKGGTTLVGSTYFAKGGDGGFGGGGGGGGQGGGGGGGYGGGGGGVGMGARPRAGGGGGSYLETPDVIEQTMRAGMQSGNGDVEIDYLTSDAPCFLRGTRILTPTVEVAVEKLTEGDVVSTADGRAVAVTWIGSWSADLDALRRTENLRPICISAGALGEGMPHRDLYVSPDHAMYLDGSLIPARLLINGASVTQPERGGIVEYFHIQVEPHDILLAEGAPAESFLDLGNTNFIKSGEEPRSWEDACAPLLLAGAALNLIRQRLAARRDIPASGK